MIKGHLEKIRRGEMQVHKQVAMIPLFSGNGAGPCYLTLKEAMESHFLTITELTEGGSVPELKVRNSGPKPVLLLDGEELAGAKQNRVLNTTILVKETAETIIPVSCTEQGRWSYRSAHFAESGHIMTAKLRRVKNESVHQSLRSTQRYMSDQGAVWDAIRDQSEAARIESPTAAMRDVHEARREDLETWLGHFPLLPDQRGILVMLNGEVAGMDMVSRPEAFRVLHPKLVKSYIMDAILEKPSRTKVAAMAAEKFLHDIGTCEVQKFPSVGYGEDYRFQGKYITGSALIYEDVAIHMAFFMTNPAEKGGTMAGLNRRRSYRQ